jgi:hypothetical protein
MNDGEVEMVAISDICKALSVFSVPNKILVTQTPTVSFVFVIVWLRLHSGQEFLIKCVLTIHGEFPTALMLFTNKQAQTFS